MPDITRFLPWRVIAAQRDEISQLRGDLAAERTARITFKAAVDSALDKAGYPGTPLALAA